MVWIMPPSVSVPEKTLEHWSSQYVTYLYYSWAALWWPTRGQDIDVRLLPTRPGKAVQLELKTTTVAGAGLHDVWVDWANYGSTAAAASGISRSMLSRGRTGTGT
jgi:hypothetical protein